MPRIKLDSAPPVAPAMAPLPDVSADDSERRLHQLVNFVNAQWGFGNWSWSVTNHNIDFIDFANDQYTAGVVCLTTVKHKTLDITRANVGDATMTSQYKGSAIHWARKAAVTNALCETLLSFGGNFTAELRELLKTHHQMEPLTENNQHAHNHTDKNSVVNMSKNVRKDSEINGMGNKTVIPCNVTLPHNSKKVSLPHNNGPTHASGPPIASIASSNRNTPVRAHMPPQAAAMPIPAPPPLPRAAPPPRPPPPAPRPNPNLSFVLQPVMPPLYPPPRIPPPHPQMYPNYYEYTGPWHFTYEPYDRHGNVNLNFNIPPKNLVVNSRPGDCKSTCRQGPSIEGEPIQYGQSNQGCWIKPTIFYDGFWTEQKVKKWVAEQVEKQFPDDASRTAASPSSSHSQEPPPKG